MESFPLFHPSNRNGLPSCTNASNGVEGPRTISTPVTEQVGEHYFDCTQAATARISAGVRSLTMPCITGAARTSDWM
jgi:hypothetical protein